MTSLKTRGFYYKVYSLLPLIFLLISENALQGNKIKIKIKIDGLKILVTL